MKTSLALLTLSIMSLPAAADPPPPKVLAQSEALWQQDAKAKCPGDVEGTQRPWTHALESARSQPCFQQSPGKLPNHVPQAVSPKAAPVTPRTLLAAAPPREVTSSVAFKRESLQYLSEQQRPISAIASASALGGVAVANVADEGQKRASPTDSTSAGAASPSTEGTSASPPSNTNTTGTGIPGPEPGPARSEASAPATRTGRASSKSDPFSFDLSVTHLIDTNVNQENDETDRVNANVLGLRINYKRPNFEAFYEVGRHFYPQVAEDRDRVSHNLRAALDRELSKRFNLQTVGEISLKGSTEDRDISNQYVFSPRLEYRLSKSDRLRLIGTYRLRRFPDDPGRDALNRYATLQWQHRFAGKQQLEFGYRYETNRADVERNDYRRQTLSTTLTLPLRDKDRLTLELSYRPRRFLSRTLDDDKTLREDRNAIFAASYLRPLSAKTDVLLGYRFERRTSNDPGKGFREHTLAATVTYHF